MSGFGARVGVTSASRHEWFVDFEHWFRLEYASLFARPDQAAWIALLNEPAWRASAHNRELNETVSTDLPHNYAWFRPQPVARSVVIRLRDLVNRAAAPAAAPAALNSQH